MNKYIRIFTVTTCCALSCVPALANNCDDALYRKYNPEKCQNIGDQDTGFSFATTAAITGGTIALIGGAVAILGTSSDDKSTTTPKPNNTSLPTLPTYTMVGGDIDNVKLSSVTSTTEYTRNINQYNDIRLAYSLARGYTGAGSNIAVFDSGKNTYHGANVSQMASGTIAPNANVSIYQVADRNGKFYSFNEIGNAIYSAANNGTHIYNFSWSANNMYATQVHSREQITNITDKNFINALTDAATKNDAIFVWAAGNDYNSQSSALSATPLVIPELNGHFVNVVAWDSETGALADFSNACGITKNFCITAPGTNLESPKSSSPLNGTSFATPIVSAAISVIREAYPYMTATQVTSLLFTTARDIGDVGIDEIYGHGMLDMERATRPVGAELVPLSENVTVAMRRANVSGTIGQQIKSQDIKFAFVDSYGRPFTTSLRNNITVKNRSLAYEHLRQNGAQTAHIGNIEFGFKSSDLLKSDGFLETTDNSLLSFIGVNNNTKIGNLEFFQRATFGTLNATPAPESMISKFSNIYTASLNIGVKMNDLTFSIGTPDTIINGNMYLNTPTGRRNNGEYIFQEHLINLATRPSVEYRASYKNITAGFVDNTYGTDEVYIIAKTKIKF